MSPLYPQKKSVGNKTDNFAKDILVQAYRLHEVHSYIWENGRQCKELGIQPAENVKLANAQNPDLTTLRNNMGPTMLGCVMENKAFGTDFGVFEIGRVCEGLDENNLCKEAKVLGVALYSRTKGERELYFDLLAMLKTLGTSIKRAALTFTHGEPAYNWQHPKNTAYISYDGQDLGWICALRPSVGQRIDRKAAVVCAQLDMDRFAAIPAADVAYREPSRFPGIDIDLSLLVPEGMRYADMEPAWSGFEALSGVTLIDSFAQNGQKSLTLRFAFSSGEKTLAKEEVQPWVDGIVEKLGAAGATLRS